MDDTVEMVRTLVSAQALVTACLAVLSWSVFARLRRQEFNRWWAAAWTLSALHLGMGRQLLGFLPEWTPAQGVAAFITTLAGCLVAPALVFAAMNLRASRPIPRPVVVAGLATSVAIAVGSVVTAMLWSVPTLARFAVRTGPRTLLLAIALFVCARVFFRQARATRSWAARITGLACLLHGASQSVYAASSAYYLRGVVVGDSTASHGALQYNAMLLYLDIALTCGICLGMVLVVLEEYQRSQAELFESVSRRREMVEENTALQSEIRRREAIERTLRASEDRYRDLVEHSEDLVCTHDLDGRILSCNQAPARILGYSVEEILERRIQSFLPAAHQHLFDEYAATLRREGIATGLVTVVTRSGEHRVWSFRNTLRTDGDAAPIVRGMGRDVTEQRRAEQALRRSEEKFAVAFRASPCAMAIVSGRDDRFLDVNATFESQTGYARSELLHRTASELGLWFDAADGVIVRDALSREERVQPREVRIRRKDGRVGTFVLAAEVVEVGGDRCVLTASQDVTAWKEADARHRAILMALPDWVFLMSGDGVFLEFHARDQRHLVMSPHEFIGRSVWDVLPPDLASRMIVCYQSALRSGGPETLEYSIPIGEGERYYEVRAVRSESERVLCLVRDVTDRRRAEHRVGELQAELAHASRVMMLGTLTGSIAHEISQPLAAIQTNASAAQRMLHGSEPKVDEIRRVLDDITSDNQRIAEVLRRLRGLLKRELRDHAPVDVNALVHDVVMLVRGSFAERRVALHVEYDEQLPVVVADRVQLQQVVLNLLLNAADASATIEQPDDRRVTVTTAVSGTQVSVSVTDRGVGFPGADLDRMFEPFFTTKEDGMGLGLSICRTIMEAHGGRMTAVRNPDRGLTCSFVLDAATPPTAAHGVGAGAVATEPVGA